MQSPYLNINAQLLENALKISVLHNKEEVINLALTQFLQNKKLKKIEEKGFELTSLDELTKSLIDLSSG
jgi:hypothetical protein